MLHQLKQTGLILIAAIVTQTALAADYIIDKKGMHAAINFKIKHLGYSWLSGRFNDFDGTFTFDEKKPGAASIQVNINPASVDSNHELRDKHLRSSDFLDVKKYPESRFVSTKVTPSGDKKFTIEGNLTLHGTTRPIVINAHEIGAGKDPWGGYRRGFSGTTTISLKDFGIEHELGPASDSVELELHIEGIRK